MAVRHYADTYRLAVFRPNGQGYASIGGLQSLDDADRTAGEHRRITRERHGWTPTYRVFRVGQSGTGEVTDLCRNL